LAASFAFGGFSSIMETTMVRASTSAPEEMVESIVAEEIESDLAFKIIFFLWAFGLL
jgi:hypothetical protein